MLIADSGADQKVSTVLVGTDNHGKATPVSITSRHLTYRDSERKIHFEGGVTVRGAVDCIIAQACLDIEAELLSPDADFERIALHTPLRLWRL